MGNTCSIGLTKISTPNKQPTYSPKRGEFSNDPFAVYSSTMLVFVVFVAAIASTGYMILKRPTISYRDRRAAEGQFLNNSSSSFKAIFDQLSDFILRREAAVTVDGAAAGTHFDECL